MGLALFKVTSTLTEVVTLGVVLGIFRGHVHIQAAFSG
jgi:hypothetical protein